MYAIVKKDAVMISLNKQNINHTEFAKKVGITRNYFSQIYNGRKSSVTAAEKIACELGGNIEDYFRLYLNQRELTFV
ncbi:helix-turn-helix transcriptional regulator [Staphylococcus capitis]|uniref:helix-turn-helix transcriptional regulator n=1 Tax=Staphylococcus capitis TaxID=29388 RepID=UPI00322033A6